VSVLVILLKHFPIIKIRRMMEITQIENKYIKEKKEKINLSRKSYAPKKTSPHQMKMKSVTVRLKYFY
jgi:hypothetical protein